MSAADLALATLDGFASFKFQGKDTRAEIGRALQEATISRNIDGASTLTLEVYDNQRRLLTSGLLNQKLQISVDSFPFELAQVRKSGLGLTMTFEDLAIAALRRHRNPIKVAPRTMTHVSFAERLVKEESWLTMFTPDGLRNGEKASVELARGEPGAATSEEPGEDSWTALGRIADQRGWRRYMLDRDTVAYVPETWLYGQEAKYTLREGVNGVDNVDFDFDSGKPVATARAEVRASRWAIPVGSAVLVAGLGPVDGRWLVSGLSRSLFSLTMTVTLTKPRPKLPEPEPEAVATTTTTSSGGSSGGGSGGGSTSTVVPITFSGADQSDWPDDPKNLVKFGQGNHRLAAPAAAAFSRVERRFGRKITITDSYRSVAQQRASYNGNPNRFGKPGNSAHGEGRAVDVNLGAMGARPGGEPPNWVRDPTWKRLNDAFMAEGWCNYQFHNGSAKGRTREPWHWSYKVCK